MGMTREVEGGSKTDNAATRLPTSRLLATNWLASQPAFNGRAHQFRRISAMLPLLLGCDCQRHFSESGIEFAKLIDRCCWWTKNNIISAWPAPHRNLLLIMLASLARPATRVDLLLASRSVASLLSVLVC